VRNTRTGNYFTPLSVSTTLYSTCSGLLVPQSGGDLPRVGSGVCARHDDLALIGEARTLGGVSDGQRTSVHANFGLVPLVLPDQTSPHGIHERSACTSPASLGDASSPLPHLSRA
jgi:hypothetical protein